MRTRHLTGPLLVLLLLVASPGCLVDEERVDDGGEGPPRVGTTEGFRIPDVHFTDHTGETVALWELAADLTFLHVIAAPRDGISMVQDAHFGPVRDRLADLSLEFVTLPADPTVTLAELAAVADVYSSGYTGIPAEDLNGTLSLVRLPTVFILGPDKVIIERSDGQIGQGWMVEAVEERLGIEPDPGVGPAVGEVAPDLLWVDVNGATGWLDNHINSGRVVLLNVWEYECPFCLLLLDELAKVHANLSGTGLEMVSIDIITWETEELVRTVMEEHNASWTFAVDSDNIQARYDIWRVPALFLVDPDGVVRWTWTGFVDAGTISAEVERLI